LILQKQIRHTMLKVTEIAFSCYAVTDMARAQKVVKAWGK
jgi:hypothetical protein